MGYVAAVSLPVLAVFCVVVLLSHEVFPGTVVASAGGVLFVDVVGIVATVWKVVLGEPINRRLEPTTDVESADPSG